MRSREHFDQALDALHAELYELSRLTTTAVVQAMVALYGQDVEHAQRIIVDDQLINQRERALEAHALGLIATQQPVATDLRRLIAAIELAGELERIADYAKGIARFVIRDAGRLPAELPPALTALAEQVIALLDAVIAAFVGQDPEAAERLCAADDQIDGLYRQIEADLIGRIEHDGTAGHWVAGLLLVAHYLERVADRATNIAERMVFMLRGEVVELNP
jgi:phosphate transport system protein